ncbi:transposase [Mucinivorans hirudinis]|uniref:Transposase n=1 Tax=Mucinivorans hirudinis TaxID=1433126 RepID=A0A060RAI6_9BACT|nr:transposase [Mucinivorans hirudinis]
MRVQINKLDFKGQNIYVGIDVHLKSWSVAVMSEGTLLKRFSQNPSADALHSFLTDNYPNALYKSVYEAGFSGFGAHYRLKELGIDNIVVNPADVPTMMKEKLRKTYAIDCVKLARGLRSGDLTGIYIHPQEALEQRSLIRLRETITKDMTREKNRIKAFLYFNGIPYPEQFDSGKSHWSKRFMDWLRSIELKTRYGRDTLQFYIEKAEYQREMLLRQTRLMRVLSRSAHIGSQLKLLTSVPGIGLTIGMNFLTELGDISRFRSSDQLAAYIGLIPMCHSSGDKHNDGDITLRKHATLRCYIVEAAWRSIRTDPAMTMAYEEYCKRMKPSKAIIKIARKLINRIFFVLKRKQEYVSCVVK